MESWGVAAFLATKQKQTTQHGSAKHPAVKSVLSPRLMTDTSSMPPWEAEASASVLFCCNSFHFMRIARLLHGRVKHTHPVHEQLCISCHLGGKTAGRSRCLGSGRKMYFGINFRMRDMTDKASRYAMVNKLWYSFSPVMVIKGQRDKNMEVRLLLPYEMYFYFTFSYFSALFCECSITETGSWGQRRLHCYTSIHIVYPE